MNEHLTVLRSLMPCFYVKRGDQASIIGGVINYINELQQVLQALEAKKQRKAYTDVLSPRPSPLSPRKPPLSPRLSLSSTSSINDSVNELVASSKSAVAEVEVKFCGPNLLLKTVSLRIPGQVMKIVSTLEELEFEILQVNINMVDERMLNSFTIKVNM
ncbi:transcription factor mute [Phtheirospermum japonicum]|uniref:Transcription factor mute n=1 Tax=Phtheirospermum japonicum TaxID=374723 RepID=A0A830B1W4_9LAMI|nr:transcription factor mute [Phtheirospermum japonicum]